jgi:hypothetical protein
MAQIVFLLIQLLLLLLLCCVTAARRLSPLISDEIARRPARNAGNYTRAFMAHTHIWAIEAQGAHMCC